ncbi:MAG: GNAT family N-acetyltransferase [Pyrinomonadaceae bacterium]
MNVTIQVELWPNLIPDLKPLLPLHWEELANDQKEIPLDPDWCAYMSAHTAGGLHCATVRADGKLVGYQITFLKRGLHYQSSLFAMVDVFYLLPEYRKSGHGVALFKFAEQEFRRIGVKKIFTGTKKHLDLSALFTRLGYTESDIMFTKLL